MLKAVVFDDEFIVLKGLRELIDWTSHGIELAGTATDGLSALEMFKALRPDIVMTDIRMPGMDGLELIERIRAEAPETMCIVFSGYNEFDYVKRAINLGVIDYLEKPINIAKIQEGIQKAVDRIGEMNEVSELKTKWRQGLLEKATLELLLRGAEALPEWEAQFGPDAGLATGITVLACAEEGFVPAERDGLRAVQIRQGTEKLVALFHLGGLGGAEAAEGWEEELAGWRGAAIGSGRTYASLGDAPYSYKEALRALRYGRYLEGTGWIRFEDLGQTSGIDPALSEAEEELLFDMRLGDKDAVLRKLDVVTERFRRQKLEPDVAEVELLRLLLQGLEVAKETGGNPAELTESVYGARSELRGMETQSEMAEWMRRRMAQVMDWIVGVRQTSKHAAIEKAVAYIEAHYGRDLTQQEVADYVQMNPTYFSLLFKEQMGISYIKHLTKVRMEKAKALLAEGLPIQDISEKVGYYHARHFSEVFKKTTGMTPGQYRTTIGKGP